MGLETCGCDSSDGTATPYGLDGPDRGSKPGVGEISRTAQTSTEVHSASCTMSTVSFLRVKRPQRSADHPSLPNARLRMVWKHTFVSPLCACIGMSCGDFHLKPAMFMTDEHGRVEGAKLLLKGRMR
jgi:hypothetical protein